MSRTCLTFAIALIAGVCAYGQAPPPPGGIGVLAFNHIVQDIGRSVEFYRDVIGLDMPTPPQPFASAPWMMDMGNTRGAQARSAVLYIPGSTLWVGLLEYKDIDRKAAHPRFQDPGVACLILTVRDMNVMMAKLKAAHARIISKGGQPGVIPWPNGTHARVVFVQDPDGFFLEIVERNPAPATTAPDSSNIIGGAFETIVADLDQTLHIYRDVLGFQTSKPTEWDGTKVMMDTAGTPGAQFRRSAATIAGINDTTVTMAFIEFKDVNRKPLHTRVQDPGAAMLVMDLSSNIDATVSELKAAGVAVISKNRESVMLSGPEKRYIVRDPNNLFVELINLPETKL